MDIKPAALEVKHYLIETMVERPGKPAEMWEVEVDFSYDLAVIGSDPFAKREDFRVKTSNEEFYRVNYDQPLPYPIRERCVPDDRMIRFFKDDVYENDDIIEATLEERDWKEEGM